MLSLPPSIVVVPESLAEPTQKLLDAYGALDGNTLPCSIVPLAAGSLLSSYICCYWVFCQSEASQIIVAAAESTSSSSAGLDEV